MTKKMNTYKKMGLILLVGSMIGGIFGGLSYIGMELWKGQIEGGTEKVLFLLQNTMLPVMILLTVITVLTGELFLRRMKTISTVISESDEEACDQWEYEFEKIGATGMIANAVSYILCIFVLSVGYSVKYIGSDRGEGFLPVCIVFIICNIYNAYWQIRYVKKVQDIHPEKKGDPTSLKFQRQWLDSCDEAEREVIYQSTYRVYTLLNKCLPFLLLITMLGHLLFQTGLLAILMMGICWLIVTVSYLRSCVKLQKVKLK